MTSPSEDFYKKMATRRSIRQFSSEPVDKDILYESQGLPVRTYYPNESTGIATGFLMTLPFIERKPLQEIMQEY